jgi:hypothetical protein
VIATQPVHWGAGGCLVKAVCLIFRGRCLETNVVSEPFASNDCFYGFTVLSFRKYATILNTAPASFYNNTECMGILKLFINQINQNNDVKERTAKHIDVLTDTIRS